MPFPKWKYPDPRVHPNKLPQTVPDAAIEAKLGDGWEDRPFPEVKKPNLPPKLEPGACIQCERLKLQFDTSWKKLSLENDLQIKKSELLEQHNAVLTRESSEVREQLRQAHESMDAASALHAQMVQEFAALRTSHAELEAAHAELQGKYDATTEAKDDALQAEADKTAKQPKTKK